jgi:hypothetical protein
MKIVCSKPEMFVKMNSLAEVSVENAVVLIVFVSVTVA